MACIAFVLTTVNLCLGTYILFYFIFICSITNHTAQQRDKNSGTGRTRLTALTAALKNGKIKT